MNENKKKQENLKNGMENTVGGRVVRLEKNSWYVGPDDNSSMIGAQFFDNKKEAVEHAKKNGWETSQGKIGRWFSCFGK